MKRTLQLSHKHNRPNVIGLFMSVINIHNCACCVSCCLREKQWNKSSFHLPQLQTTQTAGVDQLLLVILIQWKKVVMAAVQVTFHAKRNDHFTFIVANDHVITCNYATHYSSQYGKSGFRLVDRVSREIKDNSHFKSEMCQFSVQNIFYYPCGPDMW